ncbi:MAG TPA: hypothetical protein VGG15_10560 [Terriglobales bacterium]|jgi:hypothetical protein
MAAIISMPSKSLRLRLSNLLLLGFCAVCLYAFPSIARAQSPGASAQPASTEMDAILFVQSLKMKDGQDAIHLVWIPQPIQRLCLGKTAEQCADIDYCIRTTNRNVSMCRNLGIPLSRLPSYPPGMVPRRQLSVTLMRLTPDYFANLQDFYHHASKASLEHLSLSARVKARVQFIRKPDDDDFNVLEILAIAPF